MDRRALFFLVAALVSLALVPAADTGHRWVVWATATAYLVLAVLSALDHRSRAHSSTPPTEGHGGEGRDGRS
jgi:hypothetical protein